MNGIFECSAGVNDAGWIGSPRFWRALPGNLAFLANFRGVTQRHPAADLIATAAFSAAWADGSFCPEERSILEVILENLGMDPAERKTRIEASTSPPPLAPPPDDFSVRLLMMRYAMAVSLADGAIESGEADFLVSLAKHLGISGRAFGILKLEVQKMVGSLASVDLLQRVEALLPQR